MRENKSPWLYQLKRQREVKVLDGNTETDILIVGGGIAGIMTAYFTLKNTEKKVMIIDSNLVAYGATGHNAGQLTTYFERSLADLAREFGVDLACDAQKSIESSWELLEEIQKDLNLETPIYKFTGYAGMVGLKQVLIHMTDNMIRYDGRIPLEKMIISENFKDLNKIPSIYSHLYEVVSHEEILNSLETKNKEYVAALVHPKGVTNSAVLSEEIVSKLLTKYADRFSIFEKTPANKIILEKDRAIIEVVFGKKDNLSSAHTPNCEIIAKNIILCTNGFEGFDIVNREGENINKSFHYHLRGKINYMSAYIDNTNESPTAISYFTEEDNLPEQVMSEEIKEEGGDLTGESYFYVTRRPFIKDGKEMGLISIGGPEKPLAESSEYERDGLCESWAEESIQNFMKKNYRKHKKSEVEYDFCWHGLLGYTSSGLRMIGFEPKNKTLLYNLGCNGIGIMPSIFGAKKISLLLKGETFAKSIFDPKG